jgi:hypothetical protein
MLLKNILASEILAILPQGIAENIARESGNKIIELEAPPQTVSSYLQTPSSKQKSIEISSIRKYLEDFIPSSRFYIRTNV